MNAETYFQNDIKGIVNNAGQVLALARQMVKKYDSPEAFMTSKFWTASNAASEWAMLTALGALADEAGRSRIGEPTIADTIMDGQAEKIRQYKGQAFRLTERQAAIILKEVYVYLK